MCGKRRTPKGNRPSMSEALESPCPSLPTLRCAHLPAQVLLGEFPRVTRLATRIRGDTGKQAPWLLSQEPRDVLT